MSKCSTGWWKRESRIEVNIAENGAENPSDKRVYTVFTLKMQYSIRGSIRKRKNGCNISIVIIIHAESHSLRLALIVMSFTSRGSINLCSILLSREDSPEYWRSDGLA